MIEKENGAGRREKKGMQKNGGVEERRGRE